MSLGDNVTQRRKEREDNRNPTKIRRRALLGAAGAAGATFLAGCGGLDVGGAEDQGSTWWVGDLAADPAGLDPHAISADSIGAFMVFPPNAYETLVFYSPGSSELQPVLATEVPSVDNGLISDDGLSYEFPLREGVTFHTGGEMLAEDVKYSVERARTLGLSDEIPALDRIESVEVVDDYRVRFTLADRFAAFLSGTVPQKIMSVLSKQAIEDNGGVQEGQRNEWIQDNSAGTGAFYLDDWQRGSSIRWEFHDEYWDPDSIGPRGVFQRITPDVSTSVSLMEREQIHYTFHELDAIESFEGTPAELSYYTSLDQTLLFFNYEIPYDRDNMPDNDTIPSDFFQDPNVRKGFAYSIDYEEYIEQAWNGHGFKSNQPCHLEPLLYYDDSAPQFEFDPERAEEFFREAGYWEEGFTLTLMTETVGEFENAILYLRDKWEGLNDRFEIRTQAFNEAEYIERRNETPWSMTTDIGGFPSFGPDPALYYERLIFGPPAEGARMIDYVDSRIPDLIEQASASPDTDERQELYSELQRICVENPPHISLNAEELVTIHHPCAEPEINPAYAYAAPTLWDISECGDLDINV